MNRGEKGRAASSENYTPDATFGELLGERLDLDALGCQYVRPLSRLLENFVIYNERMPLTNDIGLPNDVPERLLFDLILEPGRNGDLWSGLLGSWMLLQ